jgi:tetratricopeptide (TPR) repeat protein
MLGGHRCGRSNGPSFLGAAVGGVFISYRVKDSYVAAALIDRELSSRFGSGNVFLDSKSIPAGSDFTEELLARLRTCSVLLVVIGPRWLAITDEAGYRRIDDPEDWVRREIVEALASGMRVIPVLTDQAQLPAEADLPTDIAQLARRQYVSLRHRHMHVDLDHLVDRIIEAELVDQRYSYSTSTGNPQPSPTAIQQMWLAGGPGQAERRPPPRQLPASPRDFTGRAEQLAALDRLLPDEAGTGLEAVVISAVDGTAGVGKTALALVWAHRVQHRFPDGTLFTNLRGYGPGEPATPGEVLDGFLRALGVPAERMPVGLEAQAGLYRSLLAERRMLIVLDNANTAGQVRPLLPGSGGCLVLVTSRASLSGLVSGEAAIRVTLDVLTPSEAVDLVYKVMGPSGTSARSAEVIELARLCDRLPLALRVAAGRMAARPYLTVADVVADMINDHQRLDALRTVGDERTDVRATFHWSYRSLDAEQARLFRYLGLHPGPEISAAAAAAVAGLEAARTKRLLDDLAEVHLIEPVTRDRYRLHDLLRVFAAERADRDEDDDSVVEARARLLGWYAHTAARARDLVFPGILHLPRTLDPPLHPPVELTDHPHALDWLDTERANLVAAIHQADKLGFPQFVMHLVDAIHVFLISRGHWEELCDIHTVAVAAAQSINDRVCEGWFEFYRGWSRLQMSQWDHAREPLQRALTLAQELHDEPMHAWVLTALGRGGLGQQRYAEAEDYLNSALRLSQRTDNKRLESIVRQYLSQIHTRLGNYPLALTNAEHSVALRQQTNDREGDTYAIHQLAVVWQGLGNHQKVIELCTQAIDIAQIYTVFPPQTAAALDTLATSLHHTGDHSGAIACLHEALKIYEHFDADHALATRYRLQALQA